MAFKMNIISIRKRIVDTDVVNDVTCTRRGWSGGATMLGKFPVPGRPAILIIVGQGPAASVRVGVVWTFLLSSILSLLFLPLFGRRPDID